MKDNLIYLGTYILQQDMRIRLPRSIIDNLGAKKGETKFRILFDKKDSCVVLKAIEEEKETE